MRKYEVMYILDASLSDEDRNALIAKLHAIIIDDGGSVVNVDEWGIREFAYPIEKMTKGYYMVVTFEATPEAIKEFGRISRIEQSCIRHLVVNLQE